MVSPVYLCFFTTEKSFRRELKKLKVKEPVSFLGPDANATTHFLSRKNEVICIICLGDTKGRTVGQVHALLVHEVVHVWQKIKELTGESNPSSEFEAYSIQHLCETLFKAYDN